METAEQTTKLSSLASNLILSYTGNSSAVALFDGLDFPTTREESWKYNRTGQLSSRNWKFSKAQEIPLLPFNLLNYPNRIVFINGTFTPLHSNIQPWKGIELNTDVVVSDVANKRPQDAFEALSLTFPQSGLNIRVRSGVEPGVEIAVFHLFTGRDTISQPVNNILVENGSRLQITEFYIHAEDAITFANVKSNIVAENGAIVEIDSVQIGSENSFHFHQTDTVLHKDATFTHNLVTLSGKWTRNNTNAQLKGKGAACNFNGFFIPNGAEFVDNHTIIDHESSHCQSNELYRGVLSENAVGVFNGKVFVRRDAQKTNAFQSNGNVLLSDGATMNSKPELEIYADDVKCSHGSTTGQLDDEAVFYLQSRGISSGNARKMLVAAFAESVLKNIMNVNVRQLAEKTIEEKLK